MAVQTQATGNEGMLNTLGLDLSSSELGGVGGSTLGMMGGNLYGSGSNGGMGGGMYGGQTGQGQSLFTQDFNMAMVRFPFFSSFSQSEPSLRSWIWRTTDLELDSDST